MERDKSLMTNNIDDSESTRTHQHKHGHVEHQERPETKWKNTQKHIILLEATKRQDKRVEDHRDPAAIILLLFIIQPN